MIPPTVAGLYGFIRVSTQGRTAIFVSVSRRVGLISRSERGFRRVGHRSNGRVNCCGRCAYCSHYYFSVSRYDG